MIQSLALQTRVFLVNYLNNTRKGKSELRVASSSPSDSAGATQAGAVSAISSPQTPAVQQLSASKVETSSDVNFWTDLGNALRAIVGTGEGWNMIMNAESGVVVVRAMPSELREVAEFLRTMQGVVSRQVLLEPRSSTSSSMTAFPRASTGPPFTLGAIAALRGVSNSPPPVSRRKAR